MRNPALADTLRRIAAGGPDAFYVGEIAADIATAVKNARRNAAKMTVADIAQYTAKNAVLFVGSIENTAFAACHHQHLVD